MSVVSRRIFLKQTAAVGAATLIQASAKTTGAAENADVELYAGVAVREITPPMGAPLWGYSEGVRLADGVHDPLLAQALVFRCGTSSVALVTLDLGRVPRPETCGRIREHVRSAGVQNVVFCASHTHSAPFMELPGLPYVEAVQNSICAAILEAADAMRPARIGVGHAEIDIAHNRRVIRDGKCYMRWRNAERVPTSPVDKEAGVIRIDGLSGEPIAALVHYACHPVILGPDSMGYSADWPGEMRRLVKAATGAECLFLQGACGDINPYLDKTPLAEGGLEAMRAEGGKAAEAVITAWKSIAASDAALASIVYEERSVPIGLRWDITDPSQVEILKKVYGPMYDLYIGPLTADFAVPLGVLVLNQTLALAFWPGEIFVQFQRDLKTHSPLPHAFLCGFANEYHAYFPTVRDAALGGYGGITPTYVGLGAGEKLLAESLVQIGRLAGRFPALQSEDDLAVHDLPV